MSYYGDIRLGETIDVKFTTRRFSTGAPFALAGTPAVAAYPGNSTTEITAGITLTVDFDTRTGLNNVRVVATGANGYATATNYDLVITAGTVDSVSVVGEVVASFSIENRSALMPTTAARTLDVTAGGNAGIDYDNIALTNGAGAAGLIASGTLSGTHSSTTADLGTNAPANDIAGQTLVIPTHHFSRSVDTYNTGTGVATFSPSTAVTLANGDQWYLYASPPSSTGAVPAVNVTQFGGTAGTFAAGRPEVNTSHVGGTLQTAGDVIGDTNDIQTRLPAALVSGRIDASVGAAAANTITASALAADAVTEIQAGLSTLTAAQVNAEVVDALATDTYAEPGQEAPAATTTLSNKINYLYKFLRNRHDQTSTTFSVYGDDAVTVHHKATVSDDGTTFVRTEIATGP